MNENGFNYVLSAREFSYWEHSIPSIRSWYRKEIRACAKHLAIQFCKPTWAIFAPDESTLESFVISSDENFPSSE